LVCLFGCIVCNYLVSLPFHLKHTNLRKPPAINNTQTKNDRRTTRLNCLRYSNKYSSKRFYIFALNAAIQPKTKQELEPVQRRQHQ
jgi:hypothetical protein